MSAETTNRPASAACPRCGRPLPAQALAGQCPACLAAALLRPPAPPPVDAEDASDLPRRFGDYELLAEVARGGMGVVFRARQISLNRTVAVKMILAGQLSGDAAVKRFRAEASAVARLQHPGIVAAHEVGEVAGTHFFSMDFVDGRSLADMSRTAPLPARRAARYVRDAAEAIEHAHRHDILHRDVKPSNLLIDQDDRVRVTDFGVACCLEAGADATASGAVLGTPSYMSPEQASGHRSRQGPAADVYSLGATLYALLTGRPPFQADTPLETLRQVVNEAPARPRVLNRNIPADLETIALKCLRKEPAQRYASAQALADDLRRFLEGQPILARRASQLDRVWRWTRRNPALAALTFFSVLLALVLATAATLRLADAQSAATRLAERNAAALSACAADAARQAERMRFELRELSRPVLEFARDASLVAAMGRGEISVAEAQLHRAAAAMNAAESDARWVNRAAPFESWFLLDTNGVLLARWPARPGPTSFADRDYLHGAMDNAAASGLGAVHVSHVYRSRVDGLHKVGLSVAVTEGGRVLGVVMASLSTADTAPLNDDARKTALLARLDPEPGDAATNQLVVLLHPAYSAKVPAVVLSADEFKDFPQPSAGRELAEPETKTSAAAYRDPVASRDAAYAGEWLAGLAVVGNTGLLLVNQVRPLAPSAEDRALARDERFWKGAGVGLATVVVLPLLLVLLWRRFGPRGETG